MIFSSLPVIIKKHRVGDVCDTALVAYDAEQTSRSSSCYGERGARQKRPPWRIGGSAHPLAKDGRVSLVAKDGEKGPCALLRIWGRFRGVCYSAYVKTSRLCDTASGAWSEGTLSHVLEIVSIRVW